MRVVIYARVSTKDQSCELQLRDLRTYCAARGLSVLREYVDVGESGAKDSRPQLNDLMAAARKRQFDAVMVWRFDRFARSTKHLLLALEEFRSLGIQLISYQEHQPQSILARGAYYFPGREISEHAPVLAQMADIRRVEVCRADPSIFPMTMQQGAPRAGEAQQRAVNELYIEQGMGLFSPFHGDRSDVSFAGRLMMHWSNLDKREPTVKIVCRNYAERPQPGLHNWDCPNLLWELMRIRRVKLTAQQMLSRNLSEAIVDKDNHAVDACKYLLMSHPEPTIKTMQEIAAEAVAPVAAAGDLSSAYVRHKQIMEEQRQKIRPARLGIRIWRLGALRGNLGSARITFVTRPQYSIPSRPGTYNQVVGHYTTQRIKGGTQFTCVRCPYSVRTLDFDLKDGNLRTQAAQALNQHATQVHKQPMTISDPNVQKFIWRS